MLWILISLPSSSKVNSAKTGYLLFLRVSGGIFSVTNECLSLSGSISEIFTTAASAVPFARKASLEAGTIHDEAGKRVLNQRTTSLLRLTPPMRRKFPFISRPLKRVFVAETTSARHIPAHISSFVRPSCWWWMRSLFAKTVHLLAIEGGSAISRAGIFSRSIESLSACSSRKSPVPEAQSELEEISEIFPDFITYFLSDEAPIPMIAA